ncbi:integrase, catalytic region, zinc finger, CCHC-type containing protein [Tanacetum coccineum]
MDLYGPMRIQSINEKKYILVIIDDYFRFTWVKFLSSKDEVTDFMIKFLKMIQVHLNTTVQNIRTNNGTEFVNQTLKAYYKDIGISHQTSVARTPQQNGVVKRRNQTLVEAARTMLIFSKAPLFLWAEAVATDYFDELTIMASEQFSSGPGPHLMTPGTFNSGLVPNPSFSTSYVPPTKNDWDILFQPMFDELLNPPPSVVSLVLPIAAQRPTDLTGSPVSTLIDQDAPSSSNPSTQEQEQSIIISQGVEESLKTPHFHDDLLHETLHEDSTSQGSSSNVWSSHTPLDLLGK